MLMQGKWENTGAHENEKEAVTRNTVDADEECQHQRKIADKGDSDTIMDFRSWYVQIIEIKEATSHQSMQTN